MSVCDTLNNSSYLAATREVSRRTKLNTMRTTEAKNGRNLSP